MASDSCMKKMAVDLLQSLKDAVYYIDIQTGQTTVRDYKGRSVKDLPAYELAKRRIQRAEDLFIQRSALKQACERNESRAVFAHDLCCESGCPFPSSSLANDAQCQRRVANFS